MVETIILALASAITRWLEVRIWEVPWQVMRDLTQWRATTICTMTKMIRMETNKSVMVPVMMKKTIKTENYD